MLLFGSSSSVLMLGKPNKCLAVIKGKNLAVLEVMKLMVCTHVYLLGKKVLITLWMCDAVDDQ